MTTLQRKRWMRRAWLALVAAPLIAGCALPGAGKDVVAIYDFGPPVANASRESPKQLGRPLLVYDVQAPQWMDVPSIYYRLNFEDPTRPLAYASSRWVMPPAGLLSARLRQRLTAVSRGGIVLPAEAVRASHALRVELDEFSQTFDSARHSRAVVKLRVTLTGNRAVVAQRAFSVEQEATSADAEGGARALIVASDAAIAQITDWLVASLK